MESEHRARDSRQASPERAPCAEPAKRNLSSELSAPSGSHQMRRLSRSNSSTGSRLIRWSRGSRNGSAKFGYTAAEHSKASNKNLVSAFTWTADLLASIASNSAAKARALHLPYCGHAVCASRCAMAAGHQSLDGKTGLHFVCRLRRLSQLNVWYAGQTRRIAMLSRESTMTHWHHVSSGGHLRHDGW